MNVEHGRLVVLGHELGNAENKVGLERHGLLDVALVVVDDGAVEAASRELLNVELLDEATVGDQIEGQVCVDE